MPVRSGSAVWEGDLRSGHGTVKIGNGAWEGPYSFASRFEDGTGTNPEELVGAAHAGCFSMSLANGLAQAGHVAKSVRTTAKVHLVKGEDGFRVSAIDLVCEAEVPGIDPATFQEKAATAKANCPISKLLAGAEIRLEARLV